MPILELNKPALKSHLLFIIQCKMLFTPNELFDILFNFQSSITAIWWMMTPVDNFNKIWIKCFRRIGPKSNFRKAFDTYRLLDPIDDEAMKKKMKQIFIKFKPTGGAARYGQEYSVHIMKYGLDLLVCMIPLSMLVFYFAGALCSFVFS